MVSAIHLESQCTRVLEMDRQFDRWPAAADAARPCWRGDRI